MTTHALARIAPARAPAKSCGRGVSSRRPRDAARPARRRGSVARAALEESSEATAATRRTPASGASSESASARAPYAGPPRVVVLGGGFGGLYTALKLDALDGWKDDAPPRVTLVDRADRFVFKPMLYELVNETMREWEVCPEFEELLRPTDVRFRNAAAVDVRPNEPRTSGAGAGGSGGVVVLEDGSALEYDYLVVGVGVAAGDGGGVPGAAERAVPLNSLEDARVLAGALRDMETKRNAEENENELGDRETYVPRVAVVGGGYSGCELAGVVAERLTKNGARAEVDLFASSESGVLPSAPRGQRSSATARLERLGVNVVAGARATAVRGVEGDAATASATASAGSGSIEPSTRAALAWRGADGDERLASYDAVCWTVGSTVTCPESWPFQRCEKSGKIVVDASLRAKGYEDVFAVGDVAAVEAHRAPPRGVARPGDVGFEDPGFGSTGAAEATSGSSFAASPPEADPLPSTAQVAFQQADYAAWNVWAAVANRPSLPFKYQHIGDMMTTGAADAAVALPVGDAVIDGVAGAALRRAAYLYRMPTDEHRARLAGAWLAGAAQAVAEKGAAGALEEYLGLEVPEELKRLEKTFPKPPGF